ncbi:MAG: hypothetical protein ACPIOQ_30635, partial [Promethearchaeia archaeon]
ETFATGTNEKEEDTAKAGGQSQHLLDKTVGAEHKRCPAEGDAIECEMAEPSAPGGIEWLPGVVTAVDLKRKTFEAKIQDGADDEDSWQETYKFSDEGKEWRWMLNSPEKGRAAELDHSIQLSKDDQGQLVYIDCQDDGMVLAVLEKHVKRQVFLVRFLQDDNKMKVNMDRVNFRLSEEKLQKEAVIQEKTVEKSSTVQSCLGGDQGRVAKQQIGGKSCRVCRQTVCEQRPRCRQAAALHCDEGGDEGGLDPKLRSGSGKGPDDDANDSAKLGSPLLQSLIFGSTLSGIGGLSGIALYPEEPEAGKHEAPTPMHATKANKQAPALVVQDADTEHSVAFDTCSPSGVQGTRTVPRTPATTAKKNGDPSIASITISNVKVQEAVDESQGQKLRLLWEYKQEHGHVHVPQTHVFKTGETGHFLTLWRVRVCCD